jgi:adenylate cyclase
VGMYARLAEMNRERVEAGRLPIEMGVGVHRGPLMIGVIGEEMRFDGTVISDAVNLASRLESLTKYYGIRSIVSESTWVSQEHPEAHPSRFLDAVQVKGKREQVRVRELIVPDSPGSEGKIESIPAWDAAWASYAAGSFEAALAGFESIRAANPEDGAAAVFRDRCERFLINPPRQPWDGVTIFSEK